MDTVQCARDPSKGECMGGRPERYIPTRASNSQAQIHARPWSGIMMQAVCLQPLLACRLGHGRMRNAEQLQCALVAWNFCMQRYVHMHGTLARRHATRYACKLVRAHAHALSTKAARACANSSSICLIYLYVHMHVRGGLQF
jgi:hypothetical protein